MTRTDHLLTIVAEEAVEVAQRATKALRFGLTEVQEGHDANNADRLLRELNDLAAVVEIRDIIARLRAELAAAKKRIELLEHLHDKCVACGGSFGVEVPAPVCDGCEQDVTPAKHDAWFDRVSDLSESDPHTERAKT